MVRKLKPVQPGEVLSVAKSVGISGPRAYERARGERGITADTALRLAAFFGTTPEFWMNLQAHYDLELARDAVGRTALAKIRPLTDA